MSRAAVLPVLCSLVAAAPASAKTVWLCNPLAKSSPCEGDLTASAVDADGRVVRTERTRVPARPKIDCFYVYPTVSGQQTTTANRKIDPEEIAIAHYQAQRFSQDCRVWAPMYRQLTIAGIFDPAKVTEADRTRAYDDVRDAWRDYLANRNRGRGFVLIGHSQGSFVLRTLIAREIDGKPAVRRRMVSALLLGGNVLVKKGRDVGGDFEHVPACRRSTQNGCVVAYSMFNATPPEDSRFGRAPKAQAAGQEVLCTNPAALAGNGGRLSPYDYTEPFPGTLGVAVNAFIGPLPDVPTRWLIPPGTYTARCSHAGGADVLLVKASNGARDFTPSPDPGWGWHLGDVNLAYGNLTALVRRQAAAYLR